MLFTKAAVALSLAREVQVPVAPLRYLQLAIAALHLEHVARFHLLNAGKGRAAGHHGLHQLMKQPLRCEAPLNSRVSKQHFQLGAEHQPFWSEAPILRFDPEAIAHQVEAILTAVVERKGEFSTQLRQSVLQPNLLIEA